MLKKPPVLAGSRLSTIGAARRGSRKSPASRFSTLIAVVILFASIVAKDASAVPITYTEVFGSFGVCLGSGALICAVGPSGSLGGIAFSNAIVTLTFQGDTANVVPFSVFAPNGIGASGYVNLQGTASVQVTDPTTGAVLAQGDVSSFRGHLLRRRQYQQRSLVRFLGGPGQQSRIPQPATLSRRHVFG